MTFWGAWGVFLCNRCAGGARGAPWGIIINTTSQVKRLMQNQLISERVSSGGLLVCGAFYTLGGPGPRTMVGVATPPFPPMSTPRGGE